MEILLLALILAFQVVLVALILLQGRAIRHIFESLSADLGEAFTKLRDDASKLGMPEDFNPIQHALAQFLMSKVNEGNATNISRDERGEFAPQVIEAN